VFGFDIFTATSTHTYTHTDTVLAFAELDNLLEADWDRNMLWWFVWSWNLRR